LEGSIRVFVVDDNALFRHFVHSALQKLAALHVIGEESDGLRSVHKAHELQPDLILLDIGLPTLNGIAAARQIRKLSPTSKILFLSANRSWDIAEEALRSGAHGYVVKSDAASELLPAVESVLRGKRFVSGSLSGHDLTDTANEHTDNHPDRDKVGMLIPRQDMEVARQHVVGFYSNDQWFMENVTQFIETTLGRGNAAIVVATESHRNSLLLSLRACGPDIGAAIEQGRYISLDAADTLSTFMFNGMPDPVRFIEAFGNLIVTAGNMAKVHHPRVGVFGECVNLLCAEGNAEAAIQMEKLGNQLIHKYDVDILCGYSLGSSRDIMDGHTYERICAEHSAVHSW